MKIGLDAKRAFTNQSGLGNYSRELIHSMQKNYSELNLNLFTTERNNQIFNPKNVNIYTPKMKIFKNYWRQYQIGNILNKENINIYHGLSNEIPRNLNKKIKCIVTIHDLIYIKHPKFYNLIDRNIYYQKSKYACKKADKIIAISEQTKEDIINFFKVDETKISVIYQSCHNAFISPSIEKVYNKKINLILEKPFILYVGSIEERKNLIFLLEALKKMKKEIKLIFVGEKKQYYQKVKKFIYKNGLKNRILFLDIYDSETLSLIYRKSRGLVYPSINEGFGIPIIEAMYSKVPVVTSNNSIFQEIGGKYSYYFEQGNIDSLITQISNIWYESKEREDRIKINFQYVQKFNPNQQAIEIIDLYKKIL